MASSELTDAEIIAMADACAGQVDHNSPARTTSHAELLEMVEDGMHKLLENKEFTSYFKVAL